MADDAFPIQQSGVTFSGPELRNVFSAFFRSEGVISGLTLTGGTNSFSVTAGVGAVEHSSGGYVIAPSSTQVTQGVPAQGSGTRTDLVVLTVNDTAGALNDTAHPTPNSVEAGKAYVLRVNGSTAAPPDSIVLGQLEVTGSVVVARTTGRQTAADPLSVSRLAGELLPTGTSATVPTTSAQVATKGYVDQLGARGPVTTWDWGNNAYNWIVSGGNWTGTYNTTDVRAKDIPGARKLVTGLSVGRVYQVKTELTVHSTGPTSNVRFSTWVGESLAREHPPTQVMANGAQGVTLIANIRASATSMNINTRMAVNAATRIWCFDWISPNTQVIDLGPLG